MNMDIPVRGVKLSADTHWFDFFSTIYTDVFIIFFFWGLGGGGEDGRRVEGYLLSLKTFPNSKVASS